MKSRCKSLILIDEAPLRSGLSAEFRKLYDAYSKATRELKDHENLVRPAYFAWIRATFNDKIDELEMLHRELNRKIEILERIEELCIEDGYSRGEAFQQAHQEIPTDGAPEEPSPEESSFDDDSSDQQEFDPAEEGKDWESEKRSRDQARREEAQSKRTDAETAESKSNLVKSFYRKLAQALHPDLAGSQTEEEARLSRELWLETQEAYQRKDAGRLEAIWAMLGLSLNRAAMDLRVFDLYSAIKEMADKLKSVKKEKKRLSRGDPSWSFSASTRPVLAKKIRRDLERDEKTLRDAIFDVDQDLARFKPRERDLNRKPRKPDPRGQMPFDL